MRAWSDSMEQPATVGPARERKLQRLSELARGTRCTVIRLELAAVERVRRLVALGVMPGSELVVHQTWPSTVFKMGFSEFAVDEELASAIVVHTG
jgi:DtxR family transcriptional regulator, Mn-dependent transcriptional regulator